jgi:hypothetical protein
MKDIKFKKQSTVIVIARYKESTDWISKLNDYYQVLIYEKEKPEKEPYNVPINKGNEASAYLRYIIDNYDNLPKHIVLIHCHEESWHHHGSIVDLLNNYIDKDIEFENINKKDAGFNMGDYQDWKNGELGDYYTNFIQPAVGNSDMYPKFTLNENGCAQYIIYKDIIQLHTKKFYENIYKWILESNITYYNQGFFLEWTWDLFWKKFLVNFYIKKYENEKILNVIQLDKKYNYISDITNLVNNELEINNYYKITDKIHIFILQNNGTINQVILDDNYIFNKYL